MPVVNRAHSAFGERSFRLLPLLLGTVYLPSAKTVLDLLLRRSEDILKHICSKLLLLPLPSDCLRVRIRLPTYGVFFKFLID